MGTLGWGCIGAAIAACLIGQPTLTDWLERRNEAAQLKPAAPPVKPVPLTSQTLPAAPKGRGVGIGGRSRTGWDE